MLANRITKIIPFTFTLLILLFIIPTSNITATPGPWEAEKNELFLQGLYLGTQQNLIRMKLDDKTIDYPYTSQAIFALMGLHSGKLINLSQFPREIPVQIIIDQNGKIRAMRNELENNPKTPGLKLDKWGHLATLSPNQQYYTLYHFWNGLTLHSIDDKKTSSESLATLPLCSWNNDGTKLAYTEQNYIGTFDIQNRIKKLYPFPQNNLGMVRVVTSIAWSPQSDKLLYSYLEDFPQQGSDFFQLSILDCQGKELATKVINNLGPICWLSQDTIAIVINPSEEETGKILFWNYQTNKDTLFLTGFTGLCNNFCLNHQTNTLALTIAKDDNWQERLYLHNMNTKITTNIKLFIFPIHNLQWTKDNKLIFWDEINNTINILNDRGEILKKTRGFLPDKSVSENFLFFPAKPLDEPLPLYLNSYPSFLRADNND